MPRMTIPMPFGLRRIASPRILGTKGDVYAMAKFRKGDRVKILFGHRIGQVHEVVESGRGAVTLNIPGVGHVGYEWAEVELVSPDLTDRTPAPPPRGVKLSTKTVAVFEEELAEFAFNLETPEGRVRVRVQLRALDTKSTKGKRARAHALDSLKAWLRGLGE